MRTNQRRRVGLGLSLVALFMVGGHLIAQRAWAQGAPSPGSFYVQPLFSMPIEADTTIEHDGLEGATTLTRSSDGLSMTLSATGLKPFHVYTVWWILFHKPWLCEYPIEGFGACSAPDLDNLSNTAVLRAAGAIADASGTISVSGSLGVGQRPAGMPVRGRLKPPQSPFEGETISFFGPLLELLWTQPPEVHVALAEHPEVDAMTVADEIKNPGPVVAASIFAH